MVTRKIKLRPEHIPHFLYFVEHPKEREIFFLTDYEMRGFSPDNQYTYPAFRENLRKLYRSIDKKTRVKIVPTIDGICVACNKKEECGETDATLFGFLNELKELPPEIGQIKLEEFLEFLKRKEGEFYSQMYPFTFLIGEELTIPELIQIRDSKPILYKHFDRKL